MISKVDYGQYVKQTQTAQAVVEEFDRKTTCPPEPQELIDTLDCQCGLCTGKGEPC